MEHSTKYSILYHGNCIDGWFSAYLAYYALSQTGEVNMYPISLNHHHTWPSHMQITGSHVLLLDVSVAESFRNEWMAAGILSINCIDHHASAIEHWLPEMCPINTASCAAVQTWHTFYPEQAVPFWLMHIDRIDRWDNPTYEDRCIREVLNIISHKPVQKLLDEAFALTAAFLLNMMTVEGFQTTVEQGRRILEKKDAELMAILMNGSIHDLTQEYLDAWRLPENWLGTRVFIIDNTNITLDSTEAAHLVFEHTPDIVAFINYRKKLMFYGDGPSKTMYTYSARSRGFNLTEGTILRGHETSAGASVLREDTDVLPFVVTAA